MDTTKTYFGSGGLMDPEGWPAASEPKRYKRGCNQVTRSKDRMERLDEYRKLIEQGKQTPNNYLEGRKNEDI